MSDEQNERLINALERIASSLKFIPFFVSMFATYYVLHAAFGK